MKSSKAYFQRRFHYPSRDIPVICEWLHGKVLYSYYLNMHREIELHFIKSGKGAYLIENRHYPFSGKSIVLIKPHEKHCFISKQDHSYEKASLIFPLRFIGYPRQLLFINELPNYFQLSETEATEIEVIFHCIDREQALGDEHSGEITVNEIRKLFFLLKRIKNHPRPVPSSPKVLLLLENIEKNFAARLSLRSLAESFAVSPYHLAHLFKRQTGFSVKQYILQRRILEAKALLERLPSAKMASIAEQVGFNNFALFNRCFKRIAGITPSNYRAIFSSKIARNDIAPAVP